MIDVANIENTVCLAVNSALCGLEKYHGGSVERGILYQGHSRVPLCVSVARQFVYLVLHDMYCMSYSAIAEHSGYTKRKVIENTSKARHLLHVDEIYKAVYALIRDYLNC